MIKGIFQKLFYFFPVLFCFCLPFGTPYLSMIILAWTISSFVLIDVKQLKKGFTNSQFLALVLFFVITLLSAAFSQNKTEAVFSIEVKMTFVLFPYLFFCFVWPIDILKRCIISFVSGCFFASVYLIGRAFLFSFNGHPEYFFYSLFSDFIHASYFAMYLIMAIIFVLLFYDKWFKTQKSIIYSSYFFVSVFVASIFLCSSKLGLISFFICIPLTVFYKYKEIISKKTAVILISSLMLMLVISVVSFPSLFGRFNSLFNVSVNHLDKTSSESTQVRVLIWQEALHIIKHHFIFGTGVGDANDSLYEAYANNGLTGAYEHKFNAHNQFFQTFIGMGIIGFSFLFYLTFGKLIEGIRRSNFLLVLFSLLLILNFAVESMLQTAAGVLFFAFFACLLNITNENELKTPNTLYDGEKSDS